MAEDIGRRAVAKIRATLEVDPAWSNEHAGTPGFDWLPWRLITSVGADAADDGVVPVTVVTLLAEAVAPTLETLRVLNAWNAEAPMCSFVYEDDAETVALYTRGAVTADNIGWMPSVLAVAAAIQVSLAHELLTAGALDLLDGQMPIWDPLERGRPPEPHPVLGFLDPRHHDDGAERSPVSGLWQEVLDRRRQLTGGRWGKVTGAADDDGLMLEVEFVGARPRSGSAVAPGGSATSVALLRASSVFRHPRLGPGAEFRGDIRLPWADEERNLATAADLNTRAARERQAPQFGGWSAEGDRLSYTAFLPGLALDVLDHTSRADLLVSSLLELELACRASAGGE